MTGTVVRFSRGIAYLVLLDDKHIIIESQDVKTVGDFEATNVPDHNQDWIDFGVLQEGVVFMMIKTAKKVCRIQRISTRKVMTKKQQQRKSKRK